MSNQIKKNEIAEDGVLDNLLKPLKELLRVTSEVDSKLKGTAGVIKESFKFDESSKGLRELEVNLQKTNKLAEQKKTIQQDQTKVEKQLANATERLNSLSSEEAKQLLATREAIRSKTNELKASGNAYKELSLAARNLKNESKDLGAQLLQLKQEGKENSQQYQELAQRYAETSAQAANMDKDLKNLDKTVGDNFRNVGNYESAFDALNKEVAKGGMDFRDLRKRIQEYQSIAVKAGRTSPIGQKAIKEASKLQDEMDTLTQQTKALADDGANLKAALQLGEVVAGSYQSVMAAQQLLGVESEKVLEVMAKIQALQVIMNNLNKIRNALDKASELTIKAKAIANKAYNFVLGTQATVTTATTVATRLLRLAMLALPLFAIIAGITALVSWLSSASDATEDLAEKTERLNKANEHHLKLLEREKKRNQIKEDLRNRNELIRINRQILEQENNLAKLKRQEEPNIQAIIEVEKKLGNLRTELVAEKVDNELTNFDLLAKAEDERYDRVQADLKQTNAQTEEGIALIKKLSEEQQYLFDRQMTRNERRRTLEAELMLQFSRSEIDEMNKIADLKAKNRKKDEEATKEKKPVMLTEEELTDELLRKREEKDDDSLKIEQEQLEASLEKKNMQRELANIQQATTQEEFEELEIQRMIDHIDEMIKIRKLYNQDYVDLEIQRAQLTQDLTETEAENVRETVEQIGNAIADTYSNIFQRQIDELKQQEQIAKQVYGTLEKLAAEGNLAAQDSLAEQIQAQQDAQREQIKLQKRQANIEKARQVYAIIQSQLDSGKTPGQAIAEAGGFMTAIQGLIQSLPSFYEGTEDTGKAGKALDSKGGRLAVLHNNERVLTADQNKHLQGIPNPMIPVLVNKALDTAGNSYDLLALDELRRTRQAIERIPQSTYQLESVMGQLTKMVATHKTGNTTTKNIYK